MVFVNLEVVKEVKESKKLESRRFFLLFLMMGKKDVVKSSEGENFFMVLGREKEGMLMGVMFGEDVLGFVEDFVRRFEKDIVVVVFRQGSFLNFFEDVQIIELEVELEFKFELKFLIFFQRVFQIRVVKF